MLPFPWSHSVALQGLDSSISCGQLRPRSVGRPVGCPAKKEHGLGETVKKVKLKATDLCFGTTGFFFKGEIAVSFFLRICYFRICQAKYLLGKSADDLFGDGWLFCIEDDFTQLFRDCNKP